WLPAQPHRHATRIVVLQHPSEEKHPLNTARFLPIGLAQCTLHVGEEFPFLAEWIADPRYRSAVLFPHAHALTPQPLTGPEDVPWQLFVPDGTWRKAKRIMHANPVDRKSTRLNSSHVSISYAVFCLKKKKVTTLNY